MSGARISLAISSRHSTVKASVNHLQTPGNLRPPRRKRVHFYSTGGQQTQDHGLLIVCG